MWLTFIHLMVCLLPTSSNNRSSSNVVGSYEEYVTRSLLYEYLFHFLSKLIKKYLLNSFTFFLDTILSIRTFSYFFRSESNSLTRAGFVYLLLTTLWIIFNLVFYGRIFNESLFLRNNKRLKTGICGQINDSSLRN